MLLLLNAESAIGVRLAMIVAPNMLTVNSRKAKRQEIWSRLDGNGIELPEEKKASRRQKTGKRRQ